MTPPTTQPFPLSKFLHPEDYATLAAERSLVDRLKAVDGQHPHRAWEYSMALYALAAWSRDTMPTAALKLADVGGAGSGFVYAVQTLSADPVIVIDPNLPPGHIGKRTVEDYAAARAGVDQFDAMFVLSVLEHVAQPRPFLRACTHLLKPGGLLFLTVDAWDKHGPDTAHFHWMRQRIYNLDTIIKVQQDLRDFGCRSFGGSDWEYGGDQVFNYSFASVAMIRKETV